MRKIKHLTDPTAPASERFPRPAPGYAAAAWSALLAIAGLAVLCLSDPAAAQTNGALVRVDAVTTEALSQTVPVIGRLVARQSGVVAARINGPVEEMLIDVGDRVEAGQNIAILNPEALRAQRNLAAGQLAEAEAKVSTRQAALQLARQELFRLEGLRESAAFNQANFDDAQQEVAIADAEVAEAEGNVQTYAAELRLAEINLFNAAVRAPYGGVVSRRHTEVGAYLRVGDPVVDLIADEDLEIEADVPFQRLAGLQVGTAVRFLLDDSSEHWAVVRAVVPQENPLTRTRAVRFVPEFGTTENPLAAQQSVTLLVPAAAPRTVLSVHKDAVIKRGDQSIVYVVAGDSAEMRVVRLGDAVGSRLEVIDGLAEGDLAVVRGNERLRPGDSVTIDGAT